jgi:hypothetical protein
MATPVEESAGPRVHVDGCCLARASSVRSHARRVFKPDRAHVAWGRVSLPDHREGHPAVSQTQRVVGDGGSVGMRSSPLDSTGKR